MHNSKNKIFHTKVRCLEIYLDYRYRFLTVPSLAEYYEIEESRAWRILRLGKLIKEGDVYVR